MIIVLLFFSQSGAAGYAVLRSALAQKQHQVNKNMQRIQSFLGLPMQEVGKEA
jgi:hypothetical protein